MESIELEIDTSSRRFVDVSDDLQRFCEPLGDGLVSIFVPHATAGLALIELGSGSEEDLARVIDDLLPREERYRHRHGTRGHGADHVLPAIISPSVVIPVVGGKAELGVWQSLVLVDFNVDNPRRRVRFSFLSG